MSAGGPVHVQCQRAKIHRHSTAPLSSFSTPDARFSVIHVDIVRPLPPSHGYTYLLTCVDCYTRWPEAIPITSITAESAAQAFITGWISCFGVLATITTDCGRRFESQLWTNFTRHSLELNVLTPLPTTLKLTAWLNGSIDNSKQHLTQPNANAWMESLSLILFGIHTALKEDINSTTAEMMDQSCYQLN